MILSKNIDFNKLQVVKQRVFDRITQLEYGTVKEGIRIIKEEPKAFDVNGSGFECEYEIFTDSEMYKVNIWGDYERYLYSLYLLCECESSDKF